jgi:hypothetical protein
MDNGGLRPEYHRHNPSVEKIFHNSLRNSVKSKVRYFQDEYRDKADMTTYMNWGSAQAKQINAKHARIQRDLVKRLTQKTVTKSPSYGRKQSSSL